MIWNTWGEYPGTIICAINRPRRLWFPPLCVALEIGAILDIVSARSAIGDFGWSALTAGQMARPFKPRSQKSFNGPVPGQGVIGHIKSDSQFDIVRKNHRLSNPLKQSTQTQKLIEGSFPPRGRGYFTFPPGRSGFSSF
jgi:hypothetical protein